MKKARTSPGDHKSAEQHAVFCERPLQRPNYFNGRLLTEADLTSEQEYQRSKHRSHNLHCHGAGVVDGLNVSVTNDKNGSAVIIKPGVAIDPAGNEVHLCATTKFPLPGSASEIQVGIRWLERPGGSMPTVVSDPDKPATMPAYIEEGCEVVLDPKPSPRPSLVKCSSVEDCLEVLPLGRVVRRGKAWRLDRKFKVSRAR